MSLRKKGVSLELQCRPAPDKRRWLAAAPLLLIGALAFLAAQTPAHGQALEPRVEILTEAVRSDGWVQIGRTRNWVSPECRVKLVSSGAVERTLRWRSIATLPKTTSYQRCEQLLGSLFAPIEILITRDKRADGSDGWVRMANESKHWVSGSCRSELLAAGAVLAEYPWPGIERRPDVTTWRTCEQLLEELFTARLAANPIARFPDDGLPTGDGAADDDPTGGGPTGDSPPGAGPSGGPSNEAENLALIYRNRSRNTSFDDNRFRNVPMRDIAVSDLTVDRDIYNEGLLDTSTSGYFRVKCEVSHFAYDDPIVFPGQPGRAHLHMFFGNTAANAFSTFDSLLNTGTGTCNGEDLNRTAYWVPAMLDSQGNALIPDQIMVYYKNDNFRLDGANELVSPFPDNLRMIAGNGAATSPQTGYTGAWQAQPAISFSCGPAYNSNDRRQALIPDCHGSENQLEMQIAFPQCVNEAAGTYRPDQTHMSYSENGYYGARCPASHPTDISSIMYRIFFRPDSYGGSLTDLHLSSDIKMDRILPGGTTAHADWYGAWHPDAMAQWVENCNNTQADCETGLLGRNPAVSLVLRKQGFYRSGYRALAADLINLCPGKAYDPADPLRSVGMCRMN